MQSNYYQILLERTCEWSLWKGGRFIEVVFKTGFTVVKREVIDKVLKAFDGIKKNLKFTVDKFENKTPHFLDLAICINDLTIFQKNTHTGQYINMDYFTLWKWKTNWIRSLVDQAKKMCSKENLPKEL